MAKLRVVAIGHVGKARSEAVVVDTNKRVLALKIDVVANGDQRAAAVFGIDTTGGVGQDDSFHPHAPEDPDRKRHLLC